MMIAKPCISLCRIVCKILTLRCCHEILIRSLCHGTRDGRSTASFSRFSNHTVLINKCIRQCRILQNLLGTPKILACLITLFVILIIVIRHITVANKFCCLGIDIRTDQSIVIRYCCQC